MSKNILIDKELSLQQRKELKNENWERKQLSIKAKQELELSQKIGQLEKSIEYKMSRTQFKSKHSLKSINKEQFNTQSSQLNYKNKSGKQDLSQSMQSLPVRADFDETKGDIKANMQQDNLKGMTNAMLMAEKEKLFKRLKM